MLQTIFVKFCAVYIDINFTEQFSNKCILSSDHRLPEKLTAHETKVREVESERLNKWLKMLKNWDKYSGGEKLKRRIYKGIPNAVRGEVWCRVLEVNQIKQEQDGKYGEMRDKAKLLSPDIRQIDLDVNRTYRNHIMFRERYSVKQQALFNVLAAYSMYNMEIGYCQGMSQIAALLLMYMNEEESFWALSRLMSDEKHAMHGKVAGSWMDGMGLSQADAARCLNVSRSVVQRLWDQYQSEDSVSRRPVPDRRRATTHAEDRFLALLARKRRTTTVPQLVADHFQASGRRISATTVRNRLHNAGRLLIWREQRTRYHQSNTVERHSYRGGGILVWAGISLGGHTDLHVLHGGTVTGLRYRDEILDPYVRPYAAAIGNDFILMDDNARPHRARIVEEYLEDHGLERMEWPARSPDLNPIEHLWDYLGREVAALNSPPRSLHELKQGLLCVWSSLPIPVSDNLINSMGNRCRQCI
ncbi:USP6 N-terminal-like protein [Trichonephila clavipes]|nr:USP6 N-terminal-like protein [Trichonephila clavipes]